jgi:hypothetical protein
MIPLELTEAERQMLEEVLDSYLSDLRMEIADTDRLDFRTMLKERKQVIAKVLATVREHAAQAPS